MKYNMQLTPEQADILNGKKGETMAKVMETLVMFGDIFGAKRMVEVTHKEGHLVTSFGIGLLKPLYKTMDRLIADGIKTQGTFTVDPRPLDRENVKYSLLDRLVNEKVMYSQQKHYEEQLKAVGLKDANAFTCACYLDEVGNVPKKGDILSWAESSAVVYANSVLGARCNRNSGMLDLFGSIVGYVPEFGLLTDEGRKATWIIKVETTKIPEAQILGSAIGMKVVEDVPYVYGLDKWIGSELTDEAKGYLKDFGAATASNGAVGLYHIDNLTPEAKELGDKLIVENPKVYVIDDAELQRVQDNYPVIWKDKNAKPELCFVGCPHMTLKQMEDWADAIGEKLKANGMDKISVPTVFTASPAVIKELNKGVYASKLASYGVIVSYICPLMYMNNPLCKKKAVITSSNKLRTYTSARFYKENEILDIITAKEEKK